MKLPDYNTSKLWQGLRDQMGANETISLEKATYKGISSSELEELSTSGMEIQSIEDIVNADDSTFEYKGQKVLVYIKEQRTSRFGLNSYRYHISQCATITDMQRKKRYEIRYVQTTRTDGFFDVILDHGYEKEQKFLEMSVCKNCLIHMGSIYRSEILFKYTKGAPPKNFNIGTYLEEYTTKHKILPNNTPQSYKENDYSTNWSKLSTEFREEKNWTCEGCGSEFVNQKAQLHVHHINGIRNDNRKENLAALCRDCHADQPGHEHMGRSRKKTLSKPQSPNINNGYDDPIDIETIRTKNLLPDYEVEKIIERGEGERIEFKASLRYNIHRKCDDVDIILAILRTVAAFMNSDGGVILVGVNDDGDAIGLDNSFKNFDKANLYFSDKFNRHFESHLSLYCKWDREKVDDKNIMIINVKPSTQPVYFLPGSDKPTEFWIRQGARKVMLEAKDIFPYIKNRFPNNL